MNKREKLKQAEAFFEMSLVEHEFPPHLIAERTFERKMWMTLFMWAGWEI